MDSDLKLTDESIPLEYLFPNEPDPTSPWDTQENLFNAIDIQSNSVMAEEKMQTEESDPAGFSFENENMNLITDPSPNIFVPDPNSIINAPLNSRGEDSPEEDSPGEGIAPPVVVESKRLTKLPMARIKNIMKMDPDVEDASVLAVYAITKATEMLIQAVGFEAYREAANANRKTITKKDLDSVVETLDCLTFLDGALDW